MWSDEHGQGGGVVGRSRRMRRVAGTAPEELSARSLGVCGWGDAAAWKKTPLCQGEVVSEARRGGAGR